MSFWDSLYFDVFHGDAYQGTVNTESDFHALLGDGNEAHVINVSGRRIFISQPALNIGRYDADQSGGYIVIDTLN
jgi:hypothetical protein